MKQDRFRFARPILIHFRHSSSIQFTLCHNIVISDIIIMLLMLLYYSTFAKRISTIFTNKLNNFPNQSSIQTPEAQHRHVVMLYSTRSTLINTSALCTQGYTLQISTSQWTYPHVDPHPAHTLLCRIRLSTSSNILVLCYLTLWLTIEHVLVQLLHLCPLTKANILHFAKTLK